MVDNFDHLFKFKHRGRRKCQRCGRVAKLFNSEQPWNAKMCNACVTARDTNVTLVEGRCADASNRIMARFREAA